MAKLEPYDDGDHRVLSEEEINAFFDDIDADKDGIITIDELEQKLEQVHMELAPQPKSHHLNHPERRFLDREKHGSPELEKGADPEHDGLMEFLQTLLGECEEKIDRKAFCDNVRQWNIPSQDQESSEDEDAADDKILQQMGARRRWRAWWSVKGVKVLFVFCVAALTIALSVWQGVKYIQSYDIRAALGWGVILAKFSAGALYPVMFFLLLSMSRLFATFMRRFYHISRFINWDRSQSFHIWMACIGLALASLHAIGHLTGTFLTGSRPENQQALAALLGPDAVPKSYANYAQSLPGWTGIAGLSMYWVLSLLSMPVVRRWSYEVFQLGHLLMFPMMGLLSVHGTLQLLGQYPMLGFWLVFPGTLVIFERCQRIMRGFISIETRLEVLDDDTVGLTCKRPGGKDWRYAAGQYVFLQVPSISIFQWHPFTISACRGNLLQLHIKTDGDWTSKLRDLPTDRDIRVGIDGPYGAPAQRFYDFNKSLIIGSGIGITPFSAIVTDLEQHLTRDQDPWEKSRRGSTAGSRRSSRVTTRRPSVESVQPTTDTSSAAEALADFEKRRIQLAQIPRKAQATSNTSATSRRVDFHWMIRDKAYILWFSSLLNRAADLAADLESRDTLPVGMPPIDLNIITHITAKRKSISTHVFRYLLDSYRTPSAPFSALTGLKTRSHFGRPNMERILGDYHADMLSCGVRDEKVGVFFCGSPKIGEVLADTCWELTAKSRHEGSNIRYIFMMEVFG